jgi:hypothetical protein
MNEREVVDCAQIESTSFIAAELCQAFALSMLSKPMTTIRLGEAVPSSWVIFSVRTTFDVCAVEILNRRVGYGKKRPEKVGLADCAPMSTTT